MPEPTARPIAPATVARTTAASAMVLAQAFCLLFVIPYGLGTFPTALIVLIAGGWQEILTAALTFGIGWLVVLVFWLFVPAFFFAFAYPAGLVLGAVLSSSTRAQPAPADAS